MKSVCFIALLSCLVNFSLWSASPVPYSGKVAIACLKDAEDRFSEDAQYLFRLAKYHALLGKVEEAKDLVRRVFKLNGSFKADFLDDPAFDSVWESF